jgi:ketosteroid isomerase-like protein
VVRQLRGGELYKYQQEKGDGKMAEEVRKAIEKANLKWCEGVRQGNATAVAALYTDDAILLPPNSEMIRGRQGIEKTEILFQSAKSYKGSARIILFYGL